MPLSPILEPPDGAFQTSSLGPVSFLRHLPTGPGPLCLQQRPPENFPSLRYRTSSAHRDLPNFSVGPIAVILLHEPALWDPGTLVTDSAPLHFDRLRTSPDLIFDHRLTVN